MNRQLFLSMNSGNLGKMDNVITLVFTDRHWEQHTAEDAERLCRDPEASGRIVDALTEDAVLQEHLRRLIDT